MAIQEKWVHISILIILTVYVNYKLSAILSKSEKSSLSFSLASYYTSHMVLQKMPHSAIIWGFCQGRGKVSVRLNNNKAVYVGKIRENIVKRSNIWSVSLPPQPSGGPHTIYIKYTKYSRVIHSIVLTDILFGDVWFCSGQSNMGYSLNKITTSEYIKLDPTKYTEIRYFQTMRQKSTIPKVDLGIKSSKWSHLNEDSFQESNFSALCWLFGQRLYDELHYPIGLVHSSVNGTTIEQWSTYEALQRCHAENMSNEKEDRWKIKLSYLSEDDRSSLWNAMVHPFLRMVIFGVIWYQGESNVGFHRNRYNCTFPALIESWRNEWNKATEGKTGRFPFGFVQLAGYGIDIDILWSWLRWHQTADYGIVPNQKMNNTFMATAVDLPDETDPVNNIHPNDKATVADRLSWAALSQVYGKIIYPANGPRVLESLTVYQDSGFLLLRYNQPIMLRENTGFQYCCKVPSETCSSDPTTVDWTEVVTIDQVSESSVRLKVVCKPSVLLYLWSGLPCYYKQCPIYSNDRYRLPATPWRWKLL